MASAGDIKLASIAFGFTLGFGFLTVWEAIKQTRRNRSPLRSPYIYMIWGEIAANIAIAIIGSIFLDGTIGPTIPTLFFILFFWVLEVQLLMQIIVNRIAIIAEHRDVIWRLKWGTAFLMTLINIAVFIIWIPSHTVPPLHPAFVGINGVWDRVSKVLILIIDAYLNWHFLRTVQKRLLEQSGLTKYAPLVSFNAKLMIVSIAMDAMLVGTMFLKNGIVYIQFHPVAYMVKLNIEMSMANLITRLARKGRSDQDYPSNSNPNHQSEGTKMQSQSHGAGWTHERGVPLSHRSQVVAGGSEDDLPGLESGIHRRMDVDITVETDPDPFRSKWDSGHPRGPKRVDDEQPLTADAGHPKAVIVIEHRKREGSTTSADS
ncbi:hypothetical protein B0I35DRAFT_454174 [Stachybotrys elegans]|uniref:Uncharacterized protein n=1 Tax=Stachybotrys elegans TaxID=80388 RepID=A0A8K0WKT4_9HYPO|nr:hypothetical protein B0I35DRAFT_454174 [Stachybotrys elegans]